MANLKGGKIIIEVSGDDFPEYAFEPNTPTGDHLRLTDKNGIVHTISNLPKCSKQIIDKSTSNLTDLFEEAKKIVPRIEVQKFAEAMERAMREHDKDRGESWTVMMTGELIDRLNQELDELKEALVIQETSDDPPENEDPLKECADVANIAMMIWNNIKYNQEEEAKEADFLKAHPQDAGRYGG